MRTPFRRQQGDVAIWEVKEIPSGLKPLPPQPLALGEVTGHSHKIVSGEFELYPTNDGGFYVHTFTDCVLAHGTDADVATPTFMPEEGRKQRSTHYAQVIPAGLKVRVGIVQEYDYEKEEARNVWD